MALSLPSFVNYGFGFLGIDEEDNVREKRRNRGKPRKLSELRDYVSCLDDSISTLDWINSGGSRPAGRRRCGQSWHGGLVGRGALIGLE